LSEKEAPEQPLRVVTRSNRGSHRRSSKLHPRERVPYGSPIRLPDLLP
jgi:hypothetical protein